MPSVVEWRGNIQYFASYLLCTHPFYLFFSFCLFLLPFPFSAYSPFSRTLSFSFSSFSPLSLFILSPTLFILPPTFSLFTSPSPSPSSDIREADEEVEGSEEGWIYALSFADIDAVRAVRDTQGVVWCGVVWCGVVWCVVLFSGV
jgi:hypothetical protein